MKHLLFLFIILLSGCSVNSNFIDKNFIDNISSKNDYKIISMDNIDSDFLIDIYLTFNELEWNVINKSESIIKNNEKPLSARYHFDIYTEKTWEDYKKFKFFYNITITDIQTDDIVLELNGIDDHSDIVIKFKKLLKRIK